jgi:hypothetical protein
MSHRSAGSGRVRCVKSLSPRRNLLDSHIIILPNEGKLLHLTLDLDHQRTRRAQAPHTGGASRIGCRWI